MTPSSDARPCGVAPRLPRIDPARCTGCGRCVAACPPHVLHLEPVRWEKVAELHDGAACTGCSLCERRCPFRAIEMVSAIRGGEAGSRPVRA